MSRAPGRHAAAGVWAGRHPSNSVAEGRPRDLPQALLAQVTTAQQAVLRVCQPPGRMKADAVMHVRIGNLALLPPDSSQQLMHLTAAAEGEGRVSGA